jgi:hypothetical protein
MNAEQLKIMDCFNSFEVGVPSYNSPGNTENSDSFQLIFSVPNSKF